MIYQEITESQFRDAFHNMGRADSWSYQGLGALYDYISENMGDYKLDVIALDCEFCEYACIDEFLRVTTQKTIQTLKQSEITQR